MKGDGIIEKSWEIQDKIEEKTKYVGKGKYGRVLKMARKPDSDEYTKTLWITGLGIIALGGLGFVIYLLWVYAPDYLRGLFGW